LSPCELPLPLPSPCFPLFHSLCLHRFRYLSCVECSLPQAVHISRSLSVARLLAATLLSVASALIFFDPYFFAPYFFAPFSLLLPSYLHRGAGTGEALETLLEMLPEALETLREKLPEVTRSMETLRKPSSLRVTLPPPLPLRYPRRGPRRLWTLRLQRYIKHGLYKDPHFKDPMYKRSVLYISPAEALVASGP
jgi:hypothetical protein